MSCVLRRLDHDYRIFYLQSALDYPCADYPVCGLSMYDYTLLITDNESGKKKT
jgi:hypothetical protein